MIPLDTALTAIGLVITYGSFKIAAKTYAQTLGPILERQKVKSLLESEFELGPFHSETIRRSTQYYIRPRCTNIDPTQEEELRQSFSPMSSDLFTEVDKFIESDLSKRHLILLADSGTGKTSFALNYFAYNKRFKSKRKSTICLVPLGDDNPDGAIKKIPEKKDKVIILDAFDEDILAIDNHEKRLLHLMNLCKEFKKIIVTCRTQFFLRDEEIPIETGVLKLGPRKAGEKRQYIFWKLYLAPFNDQEVDRYLRLHYPIWKYQDRAKARKLVHKIPLLSIRPMLLAHIPGLLNREIYIETASDLYEAMVEAWLERETNWIDKNELRKFSELLAQYIFLNRKKRGAELITSNEIVELARDWNISLNEWQLRSRSLLNRNAIGELKFSHRSIMEHLFVRKLIYDGGCVTEPLTDQMVAFFTSHLLSTVPTYHPRIKYSQPIEGNVLFSHIPNCKYIPLRAGVFESLINREKHYDFGVGSFNYGLMHFAQNICKLPYDTMFLMLSIRLDILFGARKHQFESEFENVLINIYDLLNMDLERTISIRKWNDKDNNQSSNVLFTFHSPNSKRKIKRSYEMSIVEMEKFSEFCKSRSFAKKLLNVSFDHGEYNDDQTNICFDIPGHNFSELVPVKVTLENYKSILKYIENASYFYQFYNSLLISMNDSFSQFALFYKMSGQKKMDRRNDSYL